MVDDIDDNDDVKFGKILRRESPSVPTATPEPTIPSLPCDSGRWFGSRTSILRSDTEFVEAHTDFLRARTKQCDAMSRLVESRTKAALTLARLAYLPEIAEREYQRGRAEYLAKQQTWEYTARLTALENETRETDELTKLLIARKRLADLKPPGEPELPSGGLSPDDVIETLSALPEIEPDTLKTIERLLFGYMQEKKG